MKRRFVLTPHTRDDLDEIWDHMADRWGLDQAEIYTRQLWKHIETVADNPSRGRACEDVRAGYRQYPAGSHVPFDRLIDDGIEVARILHERMDHERHIP